VFRPILESSRLPLPIPWALYGSEVKGAQVGSQRGCIAHDAWWQCLLRPSHLLQSALGNAVVDAREGSWSDCLMGPVFLGDQVLTCPPKPPRRESLILD
jgi:hypothetical protein